MKNDTKNNININLQRPTHIKIFEFLKSLDGDVLASMECYFGGGTAISMLNMEYRLSVDVDFMCASGAGYAKLRETLFDSGFKALFKANKEPKLLRELRADRDGVRTIIDADERAILSLFQI